MKKLLYYAAFVLLVASKSIDVTNRKTSTMIFENKRLLHKFIPVNGSDITMSFREDYDEEKVAR
jgi:hypothetical protein